MKVINIKMHDNLHLLTDLDRNMPIKFVLYGAVDYNFMYLFFWKIFLYIYYYILNEGSMFRYVLPSTLSLKT